MGEDISECEILRYTNPDGDETDTRYLNFARACVHFNQGDHEQAWHYLVAANQSARELGLVTNNQKLKRRAVSLEYANSIAVPASSTNVSKAGPQLIYFAGASRSGKTTLEHCLARNAQVQPTYEMATIDRAVLKVAQVLVIPNIVDPWFMDDVPDDVLRNVFTDYVSGMCRGKQHLTNTNPINITYIGLIARLDPSAKFIFVKRDKADQIIRIFLYNYHHGNSYSTDVESIVQHIDWYKEMIDVWMTRIPERCKLVTYEEMVGDPTGTLAAVANLPDWKLIWTTYKLLMTEAAASRLGSSCSWTKLGSNVFSA